MTPQDRDMVTRMRREIAELREQTRLIPARWAGKLSVTAVDVITLSSGSDTLLTVSGVAYQGIEVPASAITSVPSSTPSGSSPGLGVGYLRGAAVWIATKVNAGAGVVTDTVAAIPNGQTFTTRKSVDMPVSGGGTAKVYLPWDF